MSRLFDLINSVGPAARSDDLPAVPVERAEVPLETRLLFHTDPRSPSADRYRLLRMRLRELGKTGKLKTVLVTSPLPHDGKSTVCLNLASALAEGGRKKVLLIEADLHRPALTDRLGLRPWKGLAECLEGALAPLSAVRKVEPLNWFLLPAGGSRTNASELLQTGALAGMVSELSAEFDWIILDSPPVLALSDAPALTRCADATLLVARADRTVREAIDEAIEIIGRQRVAGIVLNGVTSLDRTYSKYYGSSKSYYSGNNSKAEHNAS